MMDFQPPKSFEEFLTLVRQLEVLLPEEHRHIITEIISEIENTGGDKEKLEQLAMELASKIGLKF